MAGIKMWIELEAWVSYKVLGVEILNDQYRGKKRCLCRLMNLDKIIRVWVDPSIVEAIVGIGNETNECIWLLRWADTGYFVEAFPDDFGQGFKPTFVEKNYSL